MTTDNKTNVKDIAKRLLEDSIKRLTDMNTVKFSTSREWQLGYFGANKNKELAKLAVIEELRKNYTVNCSTNHGVQDYIVTPKLSSVFE